MRYRKRWHTNNGIFLITLPGNVTWVYCCWETRLSLVGVACVYSVYCNIWQVHVIVIEVLQTHCILPCCTWRVFYGCGYHLIVLSCSHTHQWCMLHSLATSLSWRCLLNTVPMRCTRDQWVSLDNSTHNLIQDSTHDTDHVHRIHPLPSTMLPMVDPLSVSSTCCPSLKTGGLRWMRMVSHAFTMQF